jgi:hypothetical protein
MEAEDVARKACAIRSSRGANPQGTGLSADDIRRRRESRQDAQAARSLSNLLRREILVQELSVGEGLFGADFRAANRRHHDRSGSRKAACCGIRVVGLADSSRGYPRECPIVSAYEFTYIRGGLDAAALPSATDLIRS